MVDRITAILMLCILASVMCCFIGKYSREQAMMLSLCVSSVVLVFVLLHLSPVFSFADRLCDMCSVNERYSVILFKSLGICYLTRFACDICRDCNENTVSAVAEISGRSALLITALPLLEDLAGFVNKLNS